METGKSAMAPPTSLFNAAQLRMPRQMSVRPNPIIGLDLTVVLVISSRDDAWQLERISRATCF